jgi:glycosyltransferase involved in cell wall biosynthesis
MVTSTGRDTSRRTRVCFVMLHYARESAQLEVADYLRQTPVHWALPQALAARGYEVHLVHLWPRDAFFVDQGVQFHFVAEPRASRIASRLIGAIKSGDVAAYQPAWRAIRLIRSLQPDVVHFHGCTLTLNLFLMLRTLRPLAPSVVLHYHGGYPSRKRITRAVQRYSFARVDRYCFSTRTHAEPFVDAGLIRDPGHVVELMETSSTFVPQDRSRSRQRTAMHGDPVFLSVGRLHPIKDPFTMLDGFAAVLREWPKAQLYLYYTSTELLDAIRTHLEERPELAGHVHLQGRARHDEMEAIYNSADFLLQASVREFSGCAVLEAMACGVIPVVTDIPSFRAMTEAGRFGALFPVGDSAGLAHAALAHAPESIAAQRIEIRAHFERSLSFDALAAQLDECYGDLRAASTLVPSSELVVS